MAAPIFTIIDFVHETHTGATAHMENSFEDVKDLFAYLDANARLGWHIAKLILRTNGVHHNEPGRVDHETPDAKTENGYEMNLMLFPMVLSRAS